MKTLRTRPMRSFAAASTGLLLPFLIVGCGGGGRTMDGTGTPPPVISNAESLRLTESFIQVEGRQSQPGYLPFAPLAGGGPALPKTAQASTCGQATVEHPSVNVIKVTVDFTGCAKEVTDLLTGKVVLTVTLTPPSWTVEYLPLTAVSGTQTWQISGMKGMSKDAAKQQTTIQAQNLAVSYTDSANPGNNRSYVHTSNLTGSSATFGEYRVWGTFTFTATGEAPVAATIAESQALVYTAGCCYPTAGTIHYTKGGASADAVFLPTCGSVKVTPTGGVSETRTLAACK